MSPSSRRHGQAGFERVFVPPCPGDEGIAVGCAAFGWHQRQLLLPPAAEGNAQTSNKSGSSSGSGSGNSSTVKNSLNGATTGSVTSRETSSEAEGGNEALAEGGILGSKQSDAPLRVPFWGKGWSMDEVEDDLEEWEPWLDIRDLEGVEVGGYLVIFSF